jgi:carbon-monoxide dehydrogenase medium subunit
VYTMRPAEFEYHRPSTLDEAIGLLAAEGARPLAGGHSLLPAMKLRLATPESLVDIGRLPGLDAIEQEDGALRIGALATHATVAASEVVRSACPALAEAAAQIGDPQVRNRGTIGGSLANADPGADYPTVVRALEATIVVRGPDGEREVAADDFLVDVFQTALRAGELVTSVRVPAAAGSAYEKHKHPASGYAVVGVAAVVAVEDGRCSRARVTVGGATASPVNADVGLVGEAPSEEAIAAGARRVADAIRDPLGDVYASGEYRSHLATVLARRALTSAFARAAG